MPFQKDQLDPDDLETVTMHKILETTSIFQRAVYLVGAECSGALERKEYFKNWLKSPQICYTQSNLTCVFSYIFKLSKAHIWYNKYCLSLFFSPLLQGELSNDQDVVEYIMNQPNVVPRINSRILTSDREYLDLTGMSKGYFSLHSTWRIWFKDLLSQWKGLVAKHYPK